MYAFFFLSAAKGEYPSPTPKGAISVYQSVGFSQWSKYRIRSSEDDLPTPIGTGVAQTHIGYGILPNMDIHASLPLLYSTFGDQDPVAGVGFITLGSKILLLQEGNDPITFSIIPAARIGSFHASSRGKVHNIGEGSIDVGAGVALGRMGYLDTGFYWFDIGGQFWYRIPSSFDLADPPSSDIVYNFNVGYSVLPSIGLGFTVEGVHRLDGQDYPASGISDADQWAALQISQMKLGGKISYFATEKMTLDVVVLRSVFAINNPIDEVYTGLGLNFFQPPQQ